MAPHNPPTYSAIIKPKDYNDIIGVHRYIRAADQAIMRCIQWEQGRWSGQTEAVRVLEPGCGPARLFSLMAQIEGIALRGIDHDREFVRYGRELVAGLGLTIPIEEGDFLQHQPGEPYHIIYSSGLHHHIAKSEVQRYLSKIWGLLVPGGLYILSDEVLAAYADEAERRLRAAIWYSHIISHPRARIPGDIYQLLAIEEAKTLLDDLAEGGDGTDGGTKQPEQIQLVLDSVDYIDKKLRAGKRTETERLAHQLLEGIRSLSGTSVITNPSIALSRGDFKVDHPRLVGEVETAGFAVEGVQTYGPILTAGAMVVYALRKPR